MTYDLGLVPDTLVVNLYAGQPFVAELIYENTAGVAQDWPVGTSVQLRFTDPTVDVVWTAPITGSVAKWDITETDVAARVNNETAELRVNGFCWAVGRVMFRGR